MEHVALETFDGGGETPVSFDSGGSGRLEKVNAAEEKDMTTLEY